VFVGGLLVLLVRVASVSFQDQGIASFLGAYIRTVGAIFFMEALLSWKDEVIFLIP
jgi:hypothetical protein